MNKITRLILAGLALLALAGGAKALTLAEIETQVRRNVRDTASSSSLQRYSDSILDGFINEVQKDISNQTWAVEASTSYALTAQTTFYDLPNAFVAAKRATFTFGPTIRLTGVTEQSVLDSNPDFERSSKGTPVQYFIRQSKTAGDTAMEIAYLPVPQSSSSTGTVRVDYVVQPTDMDDDADVPFNGLRHLYPHHMAIVWGTTLRIKLLEGKTDEAELYSQLYDRSIQILRDSVGKLPDYRPSFSGGAR